MEWNYGICKSQGRWGETEEGMGITLKDIHRGQDRPTQKIGNDT